VRRRQCRDEDEGQARNPGGALLDHLLVRRFAGKLRASCDRGRRRRDVGGERVEFGVNGQRLADPEVELFLSQPALGVRGLERRDRLLASGHVRYLP
jgi:hypothetical protein